MIKLGIIGSGGIAHWHARTYQNFRGCSVKAVCDIDHKKAQEFAEKNGIPCAYGSLEDMLAENELDAVSNATSDVAHAPTSLLAIKHGLDIFCEKPLATNYTDAKKMTAAVRRRQVINMVNFSYRNSSAIQRAHKMVQNGDLGDITHFEASYIQSWLVASSWGDWKTSPAWLWRLSTEHGSMGALGDIGVHIIDFATFAAGDIKKVQCRLKTFEKLKGKHKNGYRLDANDTAVINAELKNGAMGVIHTTRWGTGYSNTLRLIVNGTRGALRIDLDKSYTSLEVCRGKDIDTFSWREVKCGKTPPLMNRFIKSIRTGENDQPDFARGAVVQKVLDACVTSHETGEIITV
jgi:predicted dehydrogenase